MSEVNSFEIRSAMFANKTKLCSFTTTVHPDENADSFQEQSCISCKKLEGAEGSGSSGTKTHRALRPEATRPSSVSNATSPAISLHLLHM
ncbi:Protein of unknown function [Gryllus bimaculatus]|nr:Protein of unknown function [Gryllus bimaculatus]